MAFTELPALPVPHAELPKHLAAHADTPMTELLAPYRAHEAALRQVYAQQPGHPAAADPHANVLPLFTEDTAACVRVRARDLAAETAAEKAKYIMPLPDDNRRPHGAPAVVPSLADFQSNFAVFSESSLASLAWDNVVAAGSSVVNCLLPVPRQYRQTRRSLREYYHEKFCPASDVDLFLYGLTEAQAAQKILEIETSIRDSVLAETTTVRTKHAVTICSEYPTRHVQIVLRIYKNVSEILAGFDIDCSGAAYDGRQVYCTPRALQAYMTQINHIDLTRRSPSYESRLSKYSHRSFEVYYPDLDRARVDPTIFERSFARTQGLARLLVLERLPSARDRVYYAVQRRRERGRPGVQHYIPSYGVGAGNIKEQHDDEVAEWVSQDDVNNYDTFVLPYGPKYTAKRIEKLCYTRDLLLNAEWNQKKDREVYLHRHPAFFGRAEDVIEDCCGFCPRPVTDKEKEVAAEESKTYISGKIAFLTDDPGRQEVGSFHPLTGDDWTAMAYVGDTARLCQAIVDGDHAYVAAWLDRDGADPNRRDHTGRTPLHLAALASTPAVVQVLVDRGARLVARVADGRTALHLAAERGDAAIVKILLDKSAANEADEADKAAQRRAEASKASKARAAAKDADTDPESDNEGSDGSGEMVDGDGDDDDADARTEATSGARSWLHVRSKQEEEELTSANAALNQSDDEPDFYDINVVAWDRPCSALHLAVLGGHEEVVRLLAAEYGADVLLPVKFAGNHNNERAASLLTLSLALALPLDRALSMARTLLGLGATCLQADVRGITAFQSYVETAGIDLVRLLQDLDRAAAQTALQHVSMEFAYHVRSPLLAAIFAGDVCMVIHLLNSGAATQIDFDTWLRGAKASEKVRSQLGSFEANQRLFETNTEQPLNAAINSPNPAAALVLLERGANPDTLTAAGFNARHRGISYGFFNRQQFNALDLVRSHLTTLRAYREEEPRHTPRPLNVARNAAPFLASLAGDSWLHATATQALSRAERDEREAAAKFARAMDELRARGGVEEKKATIAAMIQTLEVIEARIVATSTVPPPDPAAEKEQQGHRERDLRRVQILHQAARRGPGIPDGTYVDDFRYAPQFTGVTDVTETRRLGYIELFEAAWRGDVDTIKRLTLAAWTPAGDQGKPEPPLVVAVREEQGSNPFSLAFFRGHYKAAAAVLEIAQAQYAPPDAPKVRYAMRPDHEVDDDDGASGCGSCRDYDSDDSERSERGPYRVLVDDEQFTIDNIGEVNMKVAGTMTPLELLSWETLMLVLHDGDVVNVGRGSVFEHVFQQNDPRGLAFLLDTGARFGSSGRPAADGKPGAAVFTLSDRDFRAAIGAGRVDMLAEVIARTGAGLPLEAMAKDSGVVPAARPRYYQGLTVYGKKRSDWAAAAGGRHMSGGGNSFGGLADAPLLHAARTGSLAATEWFCSGAPLRHYLAFTASPAAQHSEGLAPLRQAAGGFEGAIGRWLGKNRERAVFEAIQCADRTRGVAVLRYLLQALPESLTARDDLGYTPLLYAALLGHVEAVRVLLAAGADPTQRHEAVYGNVLHAALLYNPRAHQLAPLLDVLAEQDPPDQPGALLARLLCERTHHASNATAGRTPLHAWLAHVDDKPTPVYYWQGPRQESHVYECADEVVAVLRLFFGGGGQRRRVGGATLARLAGLPDGSGDTLLHTLARLQPPPEVLTALLDALVAAEAEAGKNAELAGLAGRLLRRENAVGATPLEVAWEQFLEAFVQAPQNLGYFSRHVPASRWPETAAQLFAPDGSRRTEDRDCPPIPQRIYTQESADVRQRKATLRVLAAYAERGGDGGAGRRRQLVSLNEANDVARRIRATSKRYPVQVPRPGPSGEEEEEAAAEGEEGDKEKKEAAAAAAGGKPATDPLVWAFSLLQIPDGAWPRGDGTGEKKAASSGVVHVDLDF